MSSHRVGADSEFNLRRLLLARVATGTALLVPVLYLQLLSETEVELTSLYWLIAALFGASILFGLVYRATGRRSTFVASQLTVDVVLATALVYALGGVRSPAILIYLIIAFAAGVMTPRQTALAIACWTGVAYGLMAHLARAGWLDRFGSAFEGSVSSSGAELYLRIFSVLRASCAVAAISGSYSTRLRHARHQLRTERSALEAVRQLNEQLLAGMSSGLIAADAEGTIVACNRAAERITQLSQDELVGGSAFDVLGLDDDMLRDLRRRLRKHEIYRLERRLRVADGRTRAVGMSVTRVTERRQATAANREPVSADSGVGGTRSPGGPWEVHSEGPIAGGYIFMFQDLTDIKRMERLFWMRERMAVLGEMASSLAHEIRNPLGSISGSLQVLRQGDVAMGTPRAARLMEIVTAESNRLSDIIESFLDYARPEKLEATEADLVALARETVELLQNSPEVSPTHEISVVATGEVRALVDPARIRQVFWNLARNAVQAMPDGGL